MNRFRGKKVVVTGGSRGLGRAIAAGFAAEGAQVFVGFFRNEAEADLTVAQIREHGGQAQPFCVDVRSGSDVERAFDQIKTETAGKIDVLVNNAGVNHEELFLLHGDEAWNEVVNTNLLGTARCARAAARTMWRDRAGVIVNIASISAVMASPGMSSYAASKAGVVALTATLGAELGPRGIRINAVIPGLVDAGMVARMGKDVLDDRQKKIPLGRLGNADEIARVVLFLASDDATYILGQSIIVDGGLSL